MRRIASQGVQRCKKTATNRTCGAVKIAPNTIRSHTRFVEALTMTAISSPVVSTASQNTPSSHHPTPVWSRRDNHPEPYELIQPPFLQLFLEISTSSSPSTLSTHSFITHSFKQSSAVHNAFIRSPLPCCRCHGLRGTASNQEPDCWSDSRHLCHVRQRPNRLWARMVLSKGSTMRYRREEHHHVLRS